MKGGRAGDARQRMRVGLLFPDERPGLGVHGVHRAVEVTEVDRVTGTRLPRDRADADCGADGGASTKRPVDAAGLGVERIHERVLAANEQPAAGNSGLCIRVHGIRECEGPFQLQLGNVVFLEPRTLTGLEAGILDIRAPSVPAGHVRDVSECTRTALVFHRRCRRRLSGSNRAPAEVLGERTPLWFSEIRRVRRHRAGRERDQDGFR